MMKRHLRKTFAFSVMTELQCIRDLTNVSTVRIYNYTDVMVLTRCFNLGVLEN